MSPPESWLSSWKSLTVLPIAHYRLEFAQLARREFLRAPPDLLALELPGFLSDAYLAAVRRLPEVSVLLYQVPTREGPTRTHYLPVEPVDPFAECARLALERGIPVRLIDLGLEETYPAFPEPFPDPYAVLRLGPEVFWRAWETAVDPALPRHPLDLRREQAMAFHLQRLLQGEPRVLFLCGRHHTQAVLENLARPQATPLEPRQPAHLQLFHLHPDCLDEVMSTFPFLSALYEARRNPLPAEPEAPGVTVRRRFRIGERQFQLLGRDGPTFDEAGALAASLARVARRAAGATTAEQGDEPIDRARVHGLLFEESRRHYGEETGEHVRLWQANTFWRFVRNYALTEGLLLPDFFHLLAGARSCVDDNFAYALLRLGRYYPWQRESSNLPSLRLTGDDVWFGTRKLRVRRWFPHRKRAVPRPIRKNRKRERYPGEWVESLDGAALCSYPPEDLVVEEYGRVIREDRSRFLREERTQSQPFSSSLEDGIDIRETLRNWSEGKVYVRTRMKAGGRAGAVVVIFDEDPEDERYPYRMTWMGEHEQESDMAFYATPPEEHLVGPGICRCEYGGFLMSYPPRRLLDVWRDPDYRFARLKSEALLAAGLDYTLERSVIFVAARAPSSSMRTLAERRHRQIVYIPLGSISPARVRRIRTFHILSGYDKRRIAREYID